MEKPAKHVKLHVGCGLVYLTDGWVNLDLPESGSGLAKDHPERVAKWGTVEADYYGRMSHISQDGLETGIKQDHSDAVCDFHGSWDDLWVFEPMNVVEILSRQCFEHLSIREAESALDNAARALQIGGILRLDVPDHEASLEEYRKTGSRFFHRHIFGSRKNSAAYHCMGWTRESLTAICEKHGFQRVCEEPNIHFYPAFCLRFEKQ